MSAAQFPRLTRRDVHKILHAHGVMIEVKRALKTASWQPGRALAMALETADEVLIDLFNRSEAFYVAKNGESPVASPEPPPPQPDASPAAAAEPELPYAKAKGG